MDQQVFEESVAQETAADIAARKLAYNRHQDEQRTCEECRSEPGDFRDDLEGHFCNDCHEAIREEIASPMACSQESEDAYNCPRGERRP